MTQNAPTLLPAIETLARGAHELASESATERAPEREAIERADLLRIGLVAAAAVAVRLQDNSSVIIAIAVVAAIVGGWPMLAEAWENLRERRMTMELSMTIAIAAAAVIQEWFTALVITAFVLAAEVLEGLTVGRGRRAIRDLLEFLPALATVRRAGGAVRVPLNQIRVGDIVLVEPGECVAVDGTVRSGQSFVDQAAITGESTPVDKGPGATVYAGTINQSGAFEIATERVGRETSFGKIVEAVERAEQSRAPVQKTADRYAGYLVYFALGCAALTFLITRDPRSTISVIIVAGACGIAAGTPLAILGAIGRAAHEGAIIKGGRVLESLWAVDFVAFDKTGTLTVGAPEVREVRPRAGVTENDVIEAAALAERRSEHPLAKAIVRRAQVMGLPPIEPDTFEYTPGRGVRARTSGSDVLAGNRRFLADHGIVHAENAGPADGRAGGVSEVWVVRNGTVLGAIFISDLVRSEAVRAIEALGQLGIRTVLLTGDSAEVAKHVAAQLAIDEARAQLLPDEKANLVQQFGLEGHCVAMVGDGVNDAPALVRAAVGIAMGSGTDVARESADVVLLGNDLSKMVDTLKIARRTRRIIQFNFAGTLAVDGVGVALAAFGLLNPLLAAFIHVASELTFIANSARLVPGLSPRVR